MKIKIESGDIVLCGPVTNPEIEDVAHDEALAESTTHKRKEIDCEEIEAILNKKRGRGGTLQMKAELKALIDS